MVWSVDRANRRGRDVWVSTADPPQEAYTAEHFSLQWTFVVGNGNVDWLRNPLCTPEAVFGPKAAIGFASPVEAINAIRPFAKIDACDWTRAMFARVAPGDA